MACSVQRIVDREAKCASFSIRYTLHAIRFLRPGLLLVAVLAEFLLSLVLVHLPLALLFWPGHGGPPFDKIKN